MRPLEIELVADKRIGCSVVGLEPSSLSEPFRSALDLDTKGFDNNPCNGEMLGSTRLTLHRDSEVANRIAPKNTIMKKIQGVE